MSKLKIKICPFFLSELRSLFTEWLLIVSLLFIISLCVLFWSDELPEIVKSLCEGVVASFIFYLFVDFFPKISEKKDRLLKFALELQKCINYFDQTLKNFRDEWPEFINVKLEDQQRFFKTLENKICSYEPKSKGLESGKWTKNKPEKCNLGEVMLIRCFRIEQKLERLDRVAMYTKIDSIDLDFSLEIRDAILLKPRIDLVQITVNNAALFGTHFDMTLDHLLKIRSKLEAEYFFDFGE